MKSDQHPTPSAAGESASHDALIDELTTLQRNGQLAEIIDHWKQSLNATPPREEMRAHLNKVAARLNSLGVALYNRGRFEEALNFYTLVLRAGEQYAPQVLNNVASCLKELGQLDKSSSAYRQAMDLQPSDTIVHSNLLFNMHYDSSVTPAALAAAHRQWDAKHGAGIHKPPSDYANDRQPERTLRVGLLSPDLGQHPVGIFIVRYLENTDRAQIAFSCYTTTHLEGPLTDRIRRAVAHWHDVKDMDDEALAQKIRADGIDILIDLSGHSANNRLGVVARKPAPVQISWLGYPGDSGLAAIDYVIGDPFVLPETMQPFSRAKILHLPHGFVCFDPPADVPPVTPLPASIPGAITFGCFHNPAKCGEDVIALWAGILRRLPESKLLFKYKGFGAPSTQKRFQEQFVAHGIDASRLEFQGESPLAQMYAEMNRVDLALDPFPFSGGLMTCYTLWMGVPVLTLPGESFASRQGIDFLSAIGITETIAANAQDYIDKAVTLAQDLPRLADLRKRLRPAMERSPLCDGKLAASDLQDLLRKVWRDWCRTAAI
jgi:predicted O-linked N-acetylglucosamine transferase (SPINDLY family)